MKRFNFIKRWFERTKAIFTSFVNFWKTERTKTFLKAWITIYATLTGAAISIWVTTIAIKNFGLIISLGVLIFILATVITLDYTKFTNKRGG